MAPVLDVGLACISGRYVQTLREAVQEPNYAIRKGGIPVLSFDCRAQ